MSVYAVIGAGFGDEGKGHMVDFLAAQSGPATIVVRHNGGAQAGHTVVTDKDRHVFHHWGSGAIAGAATYLSQHFIVNPTLFARERAFSTSLYVDPYAQVTTPYDVFINHLVETKLRHGSCGTGIWETVVRHRGGEFPLMVTHLKDPQMVRKICRDIREDYVLPRLFREGIMVTPHQHDIIMSDTIIEDFITHCEAFMDVAQTPPNILSQYRHDTIIFEGAQGLLLDENHYFTPHVTGSSTGLTNVAHLMAEEYIYSEINVIYVMRSYMTRHGAGPFPTYDPTLSYADTTNTPNVWQGELRFGKLDLPLITEAIEKDLRGVGNEPRATVAVTCLDQFNDAAYHDLPFDIRYKSYGPYRSDIQVQ